MGLLGLDEGDNAVLGRVDGEVAGHIGAGPGNLRSTGLTDENFAVFDFLTAEALDA